MRIATTTIDKQEAELLLRDRVHGAETSGAAGSSRTLVAEFKHGGKAPMVLAGCPGSSLPKISDGDKGVQEVLGFVMNDLADRCRIDWDDSVLKNPRFYGSLGGLSAFKEVEPQERTKRATERARAAAEGRYRKAIPPLTAEGPSGERLSISTTKVRGRGWTVHTMISNGVAELHQDDTTYRQERMVTGHYRLWTAVAGFLWGMPEGWAVELYNSWLNSQTDSARSRRGGSNHD